MPEAFPENETADEKVIVWLRPSVLKEIERKVEARNREKPDLRYGVGTYIKEVINRDLKRKTSERPR